MLQCIEYIKNKYRSNEVPCVLYAAWRGAGRFWLLLIYYMGIAALQATGNLFYASYDGTCAPDSSTPPIGQSAWMQTITGGLVISPNVPSNGLATFHDTSTTGRICIQKVFSSGNTPFSATQANDEWQYTFRLCLSSSGVLQSGTNAIIAIGFRDEFNGATNGKTVMLGFGVDVNFSVAGNQSGIALTDSSASFNLGSTAIVSTVNPFDGLFHNYTVTKYRDAISGTTKICVSIDGSTISTKNYSSLPAATASNNGFGFFVSAGGTACVTLDSLSYVTGPKFSRDGLVLWLDSSNLSTVVQEGGVVSLWKDKSGTGKNATNSSSYPIVIVPDGINAKPVMRFSGQGYLAIPQIRATGGEVSVFLVYQRSANQVNDVMWQRLFSSAPATSEPDDIQGLNFSITAPQGVITPTIINTFYDNKGIGPISLGRNQRQSGQYLYGDIAEVLVFNRSFLTADAVAEINDYLSKKWNAQQPRSQGWTLEGALGSLPSRINNQYPLSDQQNMGAWIPYMPLWDEFEASTLDSSKWYPTNPTWCGRPPALFMSKNVVIKNGELVLTFCREEPPVGTSEEYHTFTTAAVQNKTTIQYGYIEIEAKVANLQASSAFFLYNNQPDWWTEIDVFEIGGGAPCHEYDLPMNMHVWRVPADNGATNHWWVGGTWTSTTRFADAYHVFGLQWDEQEVKYYLDGVLVRKVQNTNWYQALTLNFDIEYMASWLGEIPDNAPLPQEYHIRYVRCWKR